MPGARVGGGEHELDRRPQAHRPRFQQPTEVGRLVRDDLSVIGRVDGIRRTHQLKERGRYGTDEDVDGALLDDVGHLAHKKLDSPLDNGAALRESEELALPDRPLEAAVKGELRAEGALRREAGEARGKVRLPAVARGDP